MRLGFTLVALASAGCSPATSVFLEAEWPSSHTAVVLVTDAQGEELAAPTVIDSDVLERSWDRLEPFRVFVRTFGSDHLAPNGAPLASCAIEVGGTGRHIGMPRTAWRTALIDPSDARGAAFEPERIDDRTDLDLRSLACTPPDRGCADYSLDVVDIPGELAVLSIAAINDGLVMVGADVHPGPERRSMFARIDGDEVTILPSNPELVGFVPSLAWSLDATLYGVNEFGRLFAINVEGQPIALGRSLDVDDVAVGRDGTIIAFDSRHAVELLARGRVIVERTDMPAGLTKLHVTRSDLMVAASPTTHYAFDGFSWSKESVVPAGESISDVAVDDDVAVSVGGGSVRVRDPATGVWETLPHSFGEERRFRSVASLGGGRFVTVGDDATAAVWTGSRWCDLPVDRGGFFADVDAAPSGRVAWAAARDGTRRHLVRINAPPPEIR